MANVYPEVISNDQKKAPSLGQIPVFWVYEKMTSGTIGLFWVSISSFVNVKVWKKINVSMGHSISNILWFLLPQPHNEVAL